MNLDRLDLVSLSLFGLVVRTGIVSRGAELAHLGVGAASKRISDLADVVGADQQLAFAFMGEFVGGGQGSARYDIYSEYTVLSVDYNGDKVVDTEIYLLGQTSFLQFSDLIM